MATITSGANVGAKGISGQRQAAPAPVAASAHLTVSYDNTKITTRADFMAACQAVGSQLFSS